MAHRSPDQRRAYAIHRLGVALKRLGKARDKAEKQQAALWAAVWGYATGIRPSPAES
jgi:hypothetical protein